VVDGFLNSGGTTTIALSRTRNLADTVPNVPELNAQITVEGDGADVYAFTEQGKGIYNILVLPLNNSAKYRLKILTADGKEYLSDYTEVKLPPKMDSVSWQKNANGVQVYANTHDPLNNTQYYKWDFEETWIYHSHFESELIWSNFEIRGRFPSEFVNLCWHDRLSTTIDIGTTSSLSQNIISLAPIVFVPLGDERIRSRYSINVKQYGLTKEGYDYWENLKKNTEQLGSLFDAQPTQVTGNIHCVSDPDEPVIGFIGASISDTQRIFIDNAQVQPWPYAQESDCQSYLIKTPDVITTFQDTVTKVPIDYYYVNGIKVGITGGTVSCSDCRVAGGTTTKPPFWQ